MRNRLSILLVFAVVVAGFGQSTRVDATKLLKPDAALYWPRVNSAGTALEWVSPTTTQSDLNYWTASGANVYRASGNVGIGASAPNALLHVKNSAIGNYNAIIEGVNNGTSSGYETGLLVVNSDATTNNRAGVFFATGPTASGAAWIGTQFVDRTNAYGNLYFATRGAGGYGERLTILSNGNVGVGNSAPGDLLTVGGKLTVNGAVRLDNSATSGAYLKSTDVLGNTVWASQTTAQSDLNYWTLASGNVYRSSGMVGIGSSTTPTELLQVFGNERLDGQLKFYDSGSAYALQIYGTTSFAYVNAQGSRDLRLQGNNYAMLATTSDKNFQAYTDGSARWHGGLTADPGTLPPASAIWFNSTTGAWRTTIGSVAADLSQTGGDITLTDGATVSLDASAGTTFQLTAAGDRSINAPTNARNRAKITIYHTASGAARTLSLNNGTGGFAFGSDITSLTQTASGKTDILGCIYNSTLSKWLVVSYIKGF